MRVYWMLQIFECAWWWFCVNTKVFLTFLGTDFSPLQMPQTLPSGHSFLNLPFPIVPVGRKVSLKIIHSGDVQSSHLSLSSSTLRFNLITRHIYSNLWITLYAMPIFSLMRLYCRHKSIIVVELHQQTISNWPKTPAFQGFHRFGYFSDAFC